jgi:hypothetical protein
MNQLADGFILSGDWIKSRTDDSIAVGTKKVHAGKSPSRMHFSMNMRVNNEFCDQLVTFGAFTTSHTYFFVVFHLR